MAVTDTLNVQSTISLALYMDEIACKVRRCVKKGPSSNAADPIVDWHSVGSQNIATVARSIEYIMYMCVCVSCAMFEFTIFERV